MQGWDLAALAMSLVANEACSHKGRPTSLALPCKIVVCLVVGVNYSRPYLDQVMHKVSGSEILTPPQHFQKLWHRCGKFSIHRVSWSLNGNGYKLINMKIWGVFLANRVKKVIGYFCMHDDPVLWCNCGRNSASELYIWWEEQIRLNSHFQIRPTRLSMHKWPSAVITSENVQ